MSIFSNVFGKKKDLKINSAKLVDLFTPYFNDTINPKLNATFMSALNTHALHFSKIKPQAFLNNVPVRPGLTKLLSVKPNLAMEAGAFWEKFARNYYMDNNVFIYLDWSLERLNSLWILDPDNIDVRYNKHTKQFYLKFTLQYETITTSLENIIHIARHVDNTEIFGKKSEAINQVLKIINTNYVGIENAIKSSAFLRFVLKTTTVMRPAEAEQKAKLWADTYLSSTGSGVAFIDASTEFNQIKTNPVYANDKEMAIFEKKIMDYLNISDELLSGNFTENQWQSYYETNIEPLVSKLTNELNVKIFTDREYDVGNRIKISSSDMQVMSISSKISLLSNTKEIGLYTINEYRELFNAAPIEGGDVRIVSLNYINADKADDYQMPKTKKLKKEEKK